MSSKRLRFSPSDKLRIVLEGIADEGTIADLCRREGITSTQFYTWKRQLLDSAEQVYKPKKDNGKEVDSLKETLQFKDSVIAQITEENLLLKKNPSAVWTLHHRKKDGR